MPLAIALSAVHGSGTQSHSARKEINWSATTQLISRSSTTDILRSSLIRGRLDFASTVGKK
jgi:hypothetical protein